MAAVFSGVGVALATIFDTDGEVDVPATVGHARRLVDAGVRAVLVSGSTGEAPALDEAERLALLGAVRDEVGGDAAILAGTGAASPRQAARMTAAAVEQGASAILALSPPGSRDLPGYHRAVADAAGGTPVLAYHLPAKSAPGVPVAALAGLPVVGLKDSSADPTRLLAELTEYDGQVYVGSAALLSFAGPLGATGAILAVANLEPELCIRAFEGDAKAQTALAPTHLELDRGGPVALKRLLAERYGLSRTTRLA